MGKIFKCYIKNIFVVKYDIFYIVRGGNEYLSWAPQHSRNFFPHILNVKEPLGLQIDDLARWLNKPMSMQLVKGTP